MNNELNNSSNKRKYQDENRGFNADWETDFGFIDVGGKSLCVICETTMQHYKRSNLKRHFELKHSNFDLEYPKKSLRRQVKISELKQSMFKDQELFLPEFVKLREYTHEASFIIAMNIAKSKRPYSDGEFMKKVIFEVISTLDPANTQLKKLIEDIPASRHTMERRISTISDTIVDQLKNNIKDCISFSLSIDESTDIQDFPQLAVFVRYVRVA